MYCLLCAKPQQCTTSHCAWWSRPHAGAWAACPRHRSIQFALPHPLIGDGCSLGTVESRRAIRRCLTPHRTASPDAVPQRCGYQSPSPSDACSAIPRLERSRMQSRTLRWTSRPVGTRRDRERVVGSMGRTQETPLGCNLPSPAKRLVVSFYTSSVIEPHLTMILAIITILSYQDRYRFRRTRRVERECTPACSLDGR